MAHILPGQPRTWRYPMASPPVTCIHGVPYVQQCHACGWVCPTCQRTYAPWVRECNYSHDDWQQRMDMEPGTLAPIHPAPVDEPSPAAAMRFTFPVRAEALNPGYTRILQATNEWAEVWPGVQCRLRTAGEQSVEFRLLSPEAPQ